MAYDALRRIPNADMTFIDSVRSQYWEKGTLSEKQIKALENIAKKELDKRREFDLIEPMFK